MQHHPSAAAGRAAGSLSWLLQQAAWAQRHRRDIAGSLSTERRYGAYHQRVLSLLLPPPPLLQQQQHESIVDASTAEAPAGDASGASAEQGSASENDTEDEEDCCLPEDAAEEADCPLLAMSEAPPVVAHLWLICKG